MKPVKQRYAGERTKEIQSRPRIANPEARSTEVIRIAAQIGVILESDLMHALEAIEHHLQHGYQGASGKGTNQSRCGKGDIEAATELREVKEDLAEIKERVAALPARLYGFIDGQQQKLGK